MAREREFLRPSDLADESTIKSEKSGAVVGRGLGVKSAFDTASDNWFSVTVAVVRAHRALRNRVARGEAASVVREPRVANVVVRPLADSEVGRAP